MPHLFWTVTMDEVFELKWKIVECMEDLLHQFCSSFMYQDAPVECARLFHEKMERAMNKEWLYINGGNTPGILMVATHLGRVKDYVIRYKVQDRGYQQNKMLYASSNVGYTRRSYRGREMGLGLRYTRSYRGREMGVRLRYTRRSYRGREMGLGLRCPLHRRMFQIVKRKQLQRTPLTWTVLREAQRKGAVNEIYTMKFQYFVGLPAYIIQQSCQFDSHVRILFISHLRNRHRMLRYCGQTQITSKSRNGTACRIRCIFSKDIPCVLTQASYARKDSLLFNREHEKKRLETEFSNNPAGMLVVLGPRSCGKTALLSDYFSNSLDSVYLDCRSIDSSSPQLFIRKVLMLLMEKMPMDWESLKKSIPKKVLMGITSGLTGSMTTSGTERTSWTLRFSELIKALTSGKDDNVVLNMAELIDAFDLLLGVWEKQARADTARSAGSKQVSRSKPVIVIDEANVMMGWNENYTKEMETLLRYFVSITKQNRRCHVLLVTSEYGYQTWLNAGVASQFWKSRIIGDFTKSDGKDFLELELGRSMGKSGIFLSEEQWDQVFEVCGGNAGTLVNLANEVNDGVVNGDGILSTEVWGNALMFMYTDSELPRLKKRAFGVDGVYTAAQFAEAALIILSSQHFAVPLDAMLELLGRNAYACLDIMGNKTPSQAQLRSAGMKSFEGMVNADVLSLRPYSDWAQDIPLQAFSTSMRQPLVTASSTLALYCLKLMKPDLVRELAAWRQQCEDAGRSVGWEVQMLIMQPGEATERLPSSIKTFFTLFIR
ncbi:hypothetical protein CEUSTIGMA_g1880.t1 [Chlamydomonas eustigma]|uniref:ATPase domain-containing protein n=1 Tax=Chlamydomonas eustigma TaxID=1157962 RepID=A0A250WUE4_9CHLO|nr:hypothetical protein CEUSTIGMA_g1880.t1 [Chlamydomonas eustigma]|eukprot:GAX74431.1 hypothetical protein CEUSTIGMA_g1880.t1 [Chlamydomonas eustigma]